MAKKPKEPVDQPTDENGRFSDWDLSELIHLEHNQKLVPNDDNTDANKSAGSPRPPKK
jgi:hypothetical protein